jgi:hypothetical protein
MLAANLIAPSIVRANTAPAQFTIPDTSMTISGFASPGALVQIYDDDSLIGSVIADNQGQFSKTFPAMKSGLHRLSLSFTDENKLISDTIYDTININSQSDTAIEYFLPPTLQVLPSTVTEGGLVTFRGSTAANSTVELRLDGGNIILRPQSDVNGIYSISADTTGFYAGEHPVSAFALKGGLKSYTTEINQYKVTPIPLDSETADTPKIVQPPVIRTPSTPHNTTDNKVLIRGTAAPSSQLIIYMDSEAIGSTFSGSDGNWFFNIAISGSRHEIRAINCIENQCSDYSNILEIIFTGEFSSCELSFKLDEYRHWGIRLNSGIDLSLVNIVGTAPYELLVDWGDTTSERFNRNDDSSFKLHHVYDELGQFNGTVTIVDADGCEYSRYFAVETTEKTTNWRWALGSIPASLVVLFSLVIRERKPPRLPAR